MELFPDKDNDKIPLNNFLKLDLKYIQSDDIHDYSSYSDFPVYVIGNPHGGEKKIASGSDDKTISCNDVVVFRQSLLP